LQFIPSILRVLNLLGKELYNCMKNIICTAFNKISSNVSFLIYFKLATQKCKLNNQSSMTADSKVNISCLLCGDRFENQWMLRVHIRSHLRKYACTECEKKFAYDSSLRSHMECEHSEVLCSDCGESFLNAALLKKHERRKHNRGPIFHSCVMCDMKFPFRNRLRAHMSKHKKP